MGRAGVGEGLETRKPRPRYPSDEARRKKRPYVAVHQSWPTHPRYGHAYADRDLRAIVLGVWMIAARAHASATRDQVTMSMTQIMEATACSHPPAALQLLRSACAAMSWPLIQTSGRGGVCVSVEVRNFARKQGFTTQLRAEDSANSAPPNLRSAEAQIPSSAPRSPSPPQTGRTGTFVPLKNPNGSPSPELQPTQEKEPMPSDLSPQELSDLRRQRAARYLLRQQHPSSRFDLTAVRAFAEDLSDDTVEAALAAQDLEAQGRDVSAAKARSVAARQHEPAVGRRAR